MHTQLVREWLTSEVDQELSKRKAINMRFEKWFTLFTLGVVTMYISRYQPQPYDYASSIRSTGYNECVYFSTVQFNLIETFL